MMKIKFEYVKKYSNLNTQSVDFFDYYDLLKFTQRVGFVPRNLNMQEWEIRELSQKKLKQLIMNNLSKKHFYDITEYYRYTFTYRSDDYYYTQDSNIETWFENDEKAIEFFKNTLQQNNYMKDDEKFMFAVQKMNDKGTFKTIHKIEKVEG